MGTEAEMISISLAASARTGPNYRSRIRNGRSKDLSRVAQALRS